MDTETFGQMLKRYREASGMSTEEAEKRCRVFKGAFPRYEDGRMVPSRDIRSQMEKVFGIAGAEKEKFMALRLGCSRKRHKKPKLPFLPQKWKFDTLPYLVCTADGKRPTIMQLERALHEARRASVERRRKIPPALCGDPSLREPAIAEQS